MWDTIGWIAVGLVIVMIIAGGIIFVKYVTLYPRPKG